MDLNQLVEAAVTKALADYITTRGSMDDAFLDKLADKIAAKVGQAEVRIKQELEKRHQEHIRELMQQMSGMKQYRYNQLAGPPPIEKLDDWASQKKWKEKL